MNTTAEYSTVSSFKLPFDDVGIILSAATLIPLCVVGVVGNVITIVVIITSPKLKSTFNYFILSLCVSDLTSSIISPLFVYRRTWGFDDWQWSDFLCKMFWAFDLWTSYVTSFHILLFALLRFISVQWPHQFNSFKSSYAKICIILVWILTFFAGFIPFAVWFGASKQDRSSPLPNSKWPSCTLNIEWLPQFKLYTKVAYSLFFYLPILLVIVFSIGIAIKLHVMRKEKLILKGKRTSSANLSNEAKWERKQKQILLQLGLIVGSFLLGYIPRTVFHFYTVSASSGYHQSVINWWFGFIEYLVLRISECLNPVFYNLASSKMRNETKKMLKRSINRLICSKSNDVITSSSNTNSP